MWTPGSCAFLVKHCDIQGENKDVLWVGVESRRDSHATGDTHKAVLRALYAGPSTIPAFLIFP